MYSTLCCVVLSPTLSIVSLYGPTQIALLGRHVFYGGFFETLSGMTAIPDLPIPDAFRTDFPTTTGLAAMGGSFAGVVFPLMLQPLFLSLGWAWSLRILGFIDIVFLAIANACLRSRLPPKKGGSVWPDFRIFRQVDFAVTTLGVFFME